MPPNTIKVDRNNKTWGNRFEVKVYGHERAIELHRGWLTEMIAAGERDPRQLRGFNLACWCRPDQECHADVLLELANASEGKP
jgi:hypothetical protein